LERRIVLGCVRKRSKAGPDANARYRAHMVEHLHDGQALLLLIGETLDRESLRAVVELCRVDVALRIDRHLMAERFLAFRKLFESCHPVRA